MKPHPWVWCIKRFAWNNSGISLLKQTKYGSESLLERWIGLNVILFVIFFLDLNSASPQWVLWLNSIPVREASRDLWLKTHALSQVLSSESSFCWPSCWRPKRGSYRKHFTPSSECIHPSGGGWHPCPSLSLRCPHLAAGEASGCLVQNQTYSPAFTCLPLCSLLLSLPTHSFFHAFIQQIVELLIGSTSFLIF